MDAYAAAKQRQEACTSEALHAGGASALKSLLLAGGAVAGGVRFWPAFRRATGVSSRTALIVSPFFLQFFLQSELTMNACARRAHALEASLRRAEQ
jgi:hypothetical protein